MRRKVDRLYLDIQDGLDPLEVAKEKAAQENVDDTLVEAKRSLRDMIYGSVVSGREERLLNGFIAERRPSDRCLIETKYKCDSVLADLMDQPRYTLSAEDVKTLYLRRVGKKSKAQLYGAMRILRSIWNWAQAKYDESDLFIRDPVSRARKRLGVNINRTNRRNVRLDEDEFKPYIRSVLGLGEHDHSSAHRNGRDAFSAGKRSSDIKPLTSCIGT